ncbi:hypothetical protein NA78x_003362 [Anatilimnocola sp. NA78]|uniref:hypothetical protein n=1 Tax=Anatilimnocola sp. NA78 TaxID=3415683 RepID=UPI003CE5B96A
MKRQVLVIGIAAGCALVGCSRDERLADLAQQVTHEQAAQNVRMAKSSETVAQGSRQLVTADAQARREMIGLQHALRHDQAAIAVQRNRLEAERRELAQARLRESLLGSGLTALGMLLAALSPLVIAAIALSGLWRETTNEEEIQVLIQEFVQDRKANRPPLLLEPELPETPLPPADLQPPPF